MGDESQLQETGNPGIVLSGLTSIERDGAITQRKLAHELGIALGLANAHLRRCVCKGLVEMRQLPLNRFAYHLTPQGFAGKSQLTVQCLALSLEFFPRARCDGLALLRQCEGARLIVAEIRERGKEGEFDRVDPGRSLRLGEPVRVTAGAFEDMVGKLVELRDQDRVVVLPELLGRAVPAQLRTESVEAD